MSVLSAGSIIQSKVIKVQLNWQTAKRQVESVQCELDYYVLRYSVYVA